VGEVLERPGRRAEVKVSRDELVLVHSFKNSSRGHVHFLNLHTPGMRFDEYIRRMDEDDDPDPADYDSFTLSE